MQYRGRNADVPRSWPRGRVSIIVFTDGGRILGLDDLGTNGVGITVGARQKRMTGELYDALLEEFSLRRRRSFRA